VTGAPAVAVDLDGALGDTRPLWREWLRIAGPLLGFDATALPENRAEAAAELDRRGAGNWRALPEDRGEAAEELDRWAEAGVGDWRAALARFAEDRAPVYLRPSAEVSAALRTLGGAGCRLGVFTDAPEPLARVALAQLGAERRVEALEAGTGALERLRERLGPETVVVRDPGELDLQSRS